MRSNNYFYKYSITNAFEIDSLRTSLCFRIGRFDLHTLFAAFFVAVTEHYNQPTERTFMYVCMHVCMYN